MFQIASDDDNNVCILEKTVVHYGTKDSIILTTQFAIRKKI